MIQFQFEKFYGLANNFNGLFLSCFKCEVLKLKHNKRLKGTANAWRFQSQ
ncbi:Death on curing protein, Doc toxin [Vibrio cholerae]|nr:Death on curing protein, Doc toxin [Vibrio cholerae]